VRKAITPETLAKLADNLMLYLLQIRDENKRYRLAGGKGCEPVYPLADGLCILTVYLLKIRK
jgi:hypothetical protein